MKDVKIVRVLFSGEDGINLFHEIPDKPEFNEMVYVCGVENQKELQRRGYETYLFHENPAGRFSNPFDKFCNKLEALSIACQQYDKFIMLDWDVKLIKPLDDNFYKRLSQSEILIPTYSYPIIMLDEIVDEWYGIMVEMIKKYSWQLDEFRIMPNACFIYVNNKPTFGSDLLELALNCNLKTNIEEFAIYEWSSKNLHDFIVEYEPFCIYGRPESNKFTLNNFSEHCELKLHEYTRQLITKDIYFEHI